MSVLHKFLQKILFSIMINFFCYSNTDVFGVYLLFKFIAGASKLQIWGCVFPHVILLTFHIAIPIQNTEQRF